MLIGRYEATAAMVSGEMIVGWTIRVFRIVCCIFHHIFIGFNTVKL